METLTQNVIQGQQAPSGEYLAKIQHSRADNIQKYFVHNLGEQMFSIIPKL